MRQFLFVFIFVLAASAHAGDMDCPDLTGQYVCRLKSVNDIARDDYRLDVQFALDGVPVYDLQSPTMAIPHTIYIANNQVHDGISPELQYRASCSEKKLIVKFYVDQRAIDVRIYSKGKDGFQIDTLSGDVEICHFSPVY